ncbi:MAG: dephospho-CoA kinase [Desulfuromonadales bacterium]
MVLGVTGGIAAGKSMVTEAFRQMGAAIVSADQLARDVVRPGTQVLERLVERFGRDILRSDGHLDRPALASLVFSDSRARKDLNAIMHPAIAELADKRLEELKARQTELIVYEVPLLFEAGAEKRVDAVLVVTAREDVQLRRLMQRDGLDEEQARARLEAQMPQAQKVARADYVIDNSGSRDETLHQVRDLFTELTRRPAPWSPAPR